MIELEEKAEKWVKDNLEDNALSFEEAEKRKQAYKDGYEQGYALGESIANSAIESLQKKNAELKAKYSEHIRDCHDNYFAMCKEKDDDFDKMKNKLEKENAGLKAEIVKLHKCSRCMSNGKDLNEIPCKNCYKDGVYNNWH